METITTNPAPALSLPVLLMVPLIAFLLLEMAIPQRREDIRVSRWGNNIAISLLAYGTGYVVMTLLGVWLLQIIDYTGRASLNQLPVAAQMVIFLLLLEFARWGVHLLSHKVPFLWRFHAIHHSDESLDVSSSFRHHPIEPIINGMPISLAAMALGASPIVLICYHAADLMMTVATHANVRIPAKIERVLDKVLVTPTFHRTHHFSEQKYTDSNYGAIVPWFDYLFRTFQPTTAVQQLEAPLGLDAKIPGEQSVLGMLQAPFQQRPVPTKANEGRNAASVGKAARDANA